MFLLLVTLCKNALQSIFNGLPTVPNLLYSLCCCSQWGYCSALLPRPGSTFPARGTRFACPGGEGLLRLRHGGRRGLHPPPGLCLVGGGGGQDGLLVRSLVDGAGSYSVAHRAGLLPTELTGMWGWILLRSPHQGRGSPPAPPPLSKGLSPTQWLSMFLHNGGNH